MTETLVSDLPPPAPSALVVHAQQWWTQSLRSVLSAVGYEVINLYTGGQVIDELPRLTPDVILLHATLPDMSGVELCRLLRSRGLVDPVLPIIITSSDPFRRDDRLEALRAGAWECVGFPLDADLLLALLDNYLRAKRAADDARLNSLIDSPTGLYNVEGVIRLMQEFGDSARRYGHPLGCIVLSTDTPTAEGRLAEVASALGAHTRAADVIGRISSEELILVAPETTSGGIVSLAERLVQTGGPTLKAGCFAVDDLGQAQLDSMELIVRATIALRQLQEAPAGSQVQFYRSN